MRNNRLITAALVAAVSVSVAAASDVSKVPAIPSTTPTLMTLFQVTGALILVVAAIIGTAWLMKKLTPGQLGGLAQLRVVGGLMVGAKERVVVVEVRDTWLVLGVSPNQIAMLHTLPRPDDLAVAEQPVGTFAERLARALKGDRSNPTERNMP